MWAILNHSRPLPFLQCFFRIGHPITSSSRSEGGRPLSGRDASLGQNQIHNCSRAESFWNASEDRNTIFGKSQIQRVVRELGSIIINFPSSSSGNDFQSGNPPSTSIHRSLRDMSLCNNPHSNNTCLQIFIPLNESGGVTLFWKGCDAWTFPYC